MNGKRVDSPGDELAALDYISEITVAGDSSLMEIRTLYGVTESD